jgi:hypothetical protein
MSRKEARKEIRLIAKFYGFTVRIRRQAKPVENYYNQKPYTRGYYSIPRKEVVVVIPWNIKKNSRHLISIMAHEVRHGIHHALGLYKDYYRVEHRDKLTEFYKTGKVPHLYVPPNLGVAMRAELDCDAWMRSFLKKHKLKDKAITNVWYPLHMVMGYHMVHSLATKEKK